MIEVEDLHLVYPEHDSGQPNVVIDRLSLYVEQGESLSIIGPSGCGKSSFLFILAGLEKPTSGQVSIGGKLVKKPSRDVALMLQESGLLPWKTIWGNATLGPSPRPRERDKKLSAAFKELGIEGMENRYPSQVSGGERRRASLARAMAQDVHTILMDEPLAALDAITKESTQNHILSLWEKYKFTLILVTHDIEEAVFLGQKILIFDKRPTRIIETVINENMGEGTYRDTDEFYAKVQRVRGLLPH